jgi:hypothetical protein
MYSSTDDLPRSDADTIDLLESGLAASDNALTRDAAGKSGLSVRT